MKIVKKGTFFLKKDVKRGATNQNNKIEKRSGYSHHLPNLGWPGSSLICFPEISTLFKARSAASAARTS
jgi:hypothetical protein